jgi:hypothetical protein
MDISQYQQSILRRLGAPTVNVELTEEQLKGAVDDAFMEMSPYITESQYVTIPYTNRMDMTEHKVDYVINVFKSPTTDEGSLYQGNIFLSDSVSGLNIDGLLAYYAKRQLTLSIKDRITYRYIGQYLYVDMAPPVSSSITVEYVPILESVEDVKDNFWTAFILRLATANAKEVLGRIRSKYKVQNSPTELDGDTLLSEANAEKEEIRRKLEEIAYSFFPTD